MLVQSMNEEEVLLELERDFNIITTSTTCERLSIEYDRKRKKNKIAEEDSYPVYFEIKTKAKNNWLLLLANHLLIQSIRVQTTVIFAFYYITIMIKVLGYSKSRLQ
jgi:hypothetical protein